MADIINFFKFRVEGESTWAIPVTTEEGSDSLSFTSSWSQQNIQGSTEALSAFNYVQNPQIPINLKFNSNMWDELKEEWTKQNLTYKSYEETIAKFASLIYPSEQGSNIKSPYCVVELNGFVFRGYFNSIRITFNGPFQKSRTGNSIYRTNCSIGSQFTIVKSKSPTASGVASNLKTTFQ